MMLIYLVSEIRQISYAFWSYILAERSLCKEERGCEKRNPTGRGGSRPERESFARRCGGLGLGAQECQQGNADNEPGGVERGVLGRGVAGLIAG